MDDSKSVLDADEDVLAGAEEGGKKYCNDARKSSSIVRAAIEPTVVLTTPAIENTIGKQGGSKRKAVEKQVAHARSVRHSNAEVSPEHQKNVSRSPSPVGHKDKVRFPTLLL